MVSGCVTQFGDRRAQALLRPADLTVTPDLRGFATTEEPATNTTSRDWCRLMGLTPADTRKPSTRPHTTRGRDVRPNVKIGPTET